MIALHKQEQIFRAIKNDFLCCSIPTSLLQQQQQYLKRNARPPDVSPSSTSNTQRKLRRLPFQQLYKMNPRICSSSSSYFQQQIARYQQQQYSVSESPACQQQQYSMRIARATPPTAPILKAKRCSSSSSYCLLKRRSKGQ